MQDDYPANAARRAGAHLPDDYDDPDPENDMRRPWFAPVAGVTPRTGWLVMSLLCALAGITFTVTTALGITERELQPHALWLCVAGWAAGNRAREFPK